MPKHATLTKTISRNHYSTPCGSPACAQQPAGQKNRALEERLFQQAVQSEQSSRQIYDLGIKLTQAEEGERRRLAQVLHDDLQQTLSAAYLRASMIKTKTGDVELIRALTCLEEMIAESIVTTRSLTIDLCPPVLNGDFASAIDWLAREAWERFGLEVRVNVDLRAEPCNREVRVILIRGVRELLFNIVKHAGVRTASIVVVRAACGSRIVVEDQGVGFDPTAPGRTTRGGFGLNSLRERMACFGGSLELISAPGQGTRAIFVVPGGCDPLSPIQPEKSIQ